MSILQRIRQLVIDRRYYFSAHAEEEMWADGLERPDIEWCILRGRIERGFTDYHRICGRGGAMICEFYGGKTIKKKGRKVHWLQQQLFVIDDVEAEVCQDCGERYYHATTLDAMDHMLLAGNLSVKQQLQVSVVGMPA